MLRKASGQLLLGLHNMRLSCGFPCQAIALDAVDVSCEALLLGIAPGQSDKLYTLSKKTCASVT